MPDQASDRPHRKTVRSIRFTAAEWVTVTEKLAGRDYSATVRALLLDAPIPEPKTGRKPAPIIVRKHMTEFEAEKIRALAWIGNNLNQLAKQANTQRTALPVLASLVSIEREIRRLAGP